MAYRIIYLLIFLKRITMFLSPHWNRWYTDAYKVLMLHEHSLTDAIVYVLLLNIHLFEKGVMGSFNLCLSHCDIQAFKSNSVTYDTCICKLYITSSHPSILQYESTWYILTRMIFGFSDCADRNAACAYWASVGECNKNPNYMRVNCKRACASCWTGGNKS